MVRPREDAGGSRWGPRGEWGGMKHKLLCLNHYFKYTVKLPSAVYNSVFLVSQHSVRTHTHKLNVLKILCM